MRWFLDFYEIRDLHDIEIFIEKEKTEFVVIHCNADTLQLILEIYEIGNKEINKFEELCEKEMIAELAMFPVKNLEFIFKIYDINTPEDIESFFKEKKEIFELLYSPSENFEYILNLYHIDNQKKLEEFCINSDPKIIKLTSVQAESFKFVINLYNVKSIDNFEKLSQIENIYSILNNRTETLKQSLDFCEVKTEEEFEEFCDNSDVYKSLKLLDEDFDKFKKFDFGEETYDGESIILEEIFPLFESHPLCKKIQDDFLDKLKKVRGNYVAENFPNDISSKISASVFFDYYLFQNAKKENFPDEILEKIKNKKPEIYKKIMHNNIRLEDVLLSKRTVKKLTENENINYLIAIKQLDKFSQFDCCSIFGKNLDDIKEDLKFEIRRIADNYFSKKEEYELFLSSLLGYGGIETKKTKEILNIENLWDYKFDHIKDLKLVVDEIKNLSLSTKDNGSVEILQKAAEHLGAINMNPSCMAPGGKYDQYAFTVVEGPILIIGVKDDEGRITGRSLLIPVQNENSKGEKNWYFEIKNTYGVGQEDIEKFCQIIEENLKEKGLYKKDEKIIHKKIVDGKLPSKKGNSDYFYRDGTALTQLEGTKQKFL